MSTTTRTPDAAAIVEPEAVIPVPDAPHSVAVSHDGSRAYVTHMRSGQVSVIDTATLTVVRTDDAGSAGLYGVTVSLDDAGYYVANSDTGFVRRIDAATGEGGIDAGITTKPYGLCTGLRGKLYAACALEDKIEVLDANAKNMGSLTGVDFPVGVVSSPDGKRLYISNYSRSSVTVVDPPDEDGSIGVVPATGPGTVDLPEGPYGVALNPDGTRLYVAHFASRDIVSVVETATLEVVDTLELGNGGARGIACSADGTRLFLTDFFRSSVSVVRV